MSYRDLPAVITRREEALTLLQAMASGADERELAPFVSAMMTFEAEQAMSVMHGSGNEMALHVQLGALLAEGGLVSQDEVFAALDARRALARGQAA